MSYFTIVVGHVGCQRLCASATTRPAEQHDVAMRRIRRLWLKTQHLHFCRFWKGYKPISYFLMSKINPLKPVDSKRTVSLETIAPHHVIEKHKLESKREVYRRRNEAYIKTMYGSPFEKEEVRWVEKFSST